MAKTPAQRMKKHGSRAVVPATQLPPVINPSTNRSEAKAQSNGKMIVIAAVVAALFLFWYLHILTLGQMTQLSDGKAMPDSMVFGFDAAHIEALRSAMSENDRGQLNWLHKTAGTLFPLIFGFAWLIMIGLNTARRALRWILWVPPVLFVITRLAGNFAIDALFGSEAPGSGAISWASFLVVSGWVLFLLSLAAAVVSLTPLAKGRPES